MKIEIREKAKAIAVEVGPGDVLSLRNDTFVCPQGPFSLNIKHTDRDDLVTVTGLTRLNLVTLAAEILREIA